MPISPDSSNRIAREILSAAAEKRSLPVLPSVEDSSLDLNDVYAVEAEIARLRADSGHLVVGRKVGFANKAMWRALKLDTLLWASMYDDTVRYTDGSAELAVGVLQQPKLEPEIILKLRAPLPEGISDAAAVLESVEWIALGFEIIACPFADWKFTPVDFVASGGFHAGLIIGKPLAVRAEKVADLVDALAQFKLRLYRNDAMVAEGAGRNCLKSPALCMAELADASAKRGNSLRAGEVISSGTLTEAQPIVAGEVWRAEVEGLGLEPLSLRTA